jgi:hypothetical protein
MDCHYKDSVGSDNFRVSQAVVDRSNDFKCTCNASHPSLWADLRGRNGDVGTDARRSRQTACRRYRPTSGADVTPPFPTICFLQASCMTVPFFSRASINSNHASQKSPFGIPSSDSHRLNLILHDAYKSKLMCVQTDLLGNMYGPCTSSGGTFTILCNITVASMRRTSVSGLHPPRS